MNISKLSVFFPAFNEEKNISSTVNKAVEVLKGLDLKDFEVIIVDDGSKDKTAEEVLNLSKKDKRIRLVRHELNKGYGQVLKTGFKEAKFEWVAFSDSDGQFDFSDITKLIEKSDQAEFILGYRIKRADPFIRRVYTFGWKMIARILFGLRVRDYSCGFKLIKKQAFESCLPLESEEKVTQIELLVKAMKEEYRFAEVGVNHYPRRFGNPTGANIKVVLKSLVDIIKLWWKLKDQKPLFFLLLLVLILAATLRFYRLDEYMTFLGDEGRDALVVKGILENFDIPLLGPPTSVGNIYLGPLYYYMMVLPMAIFWLNPIAAAGMVAFIGVATVWLIYYLAKLWFGKEAGLVASFLYAISPITIIYSRSSWNPNPTPFFTLLTILGLYKAHTTSNYRWLLLTGVAAAFAVQMHYLALILLPILGIVWVYELLFKKTRHIQKTFLRQSILSLLLFLLLMSPLFLFDIRHDFLNTRAMADLFLRQESITVDSGNIFLKGLSIFVDNLNGRYLSLDSSLTRQGISALLLFALTIGFGLSLLKKETSWPYIMLSTWLIVGFLGLTLYRGEIYDHYLGFINPLPFLLIGSLAGILFNNLKLKLLTTILILPLVFSLAWVNLEKNPLKNNPSNQLKRTQEVAKFIINSSQGEPLNFALISQNNYDAAYQFYLGVYGNRPKNISFELTEQLFVVCEDQICRVINNSKFEIAAFGWGKIIDEREIAGVKVYKLIHNPSGKPG